MKIIALGASSSRHSINKVLATYTANLVVNAEVEVLDLNDFDLPLFSIDKENELKAQGDAHPQAAKDYYAKFESTDAFVISFAEHNGTYTAAYKNIFDWVSRINQPMFNDKPVIYLATSPGPGGAASVLAQAIGSAIFFKADVKGSLSVPNFYDVFDMEIGKPTSDELKAELEKLVSKL